MSGHDLYRQIHSILNKASSRHSFRSIVIHSSGNANKTSVKLPNENRGWTPYDKIVRVIHKAKPRLLPSTFDLFFIIKQTSKQLKESKVIKRAPKSIKDHQTQIKSWLRSLERRFDLMLNQAPRMEENVDQLSVTTASMVILVMAHQVSWVLPASET